MLEGKVEPSGVLIRELLNDISAGNIKIPAFQRGFVWDQDQVIALLDSVLNGYPIGSILLWNSRERLRSVRNIAGLRLPERDPDYPLNYVLDGQQRLSALYGVLNFEKDFDFSNEKYGIDPTLFEIHFDLLRNRFVSKAEVDLFYADEMSELPIFQQDQKESGRFLRMDSIYSVPAFIQEMKHLPRELVERAEELLGKFQSYKVPIVTITNRSKAEVSVIFERINNTGTRLSTLDLMVAWTWSDDFHLKDEIDSLLETLEIKGFSDTNDKRILQCLAAIVGGTVRTQDILDLSADSVRANINTLRRSLELTIDYLATEFNVKSEDLLPHSHQIIPLSFFFSRVNYPSHRQNTALRQWFWLTSFSRRYSGATDLRVNEDIDFMKRVADQKEGGLARYSHGISKETLIRQDFHKGNPTTRAFLLLLAQREPLDLLNGRKIDVGRALSFSNQREFHHVFPRDFLISSRDSSNVNSICNFCFLPSNTNKVISNRPPSDYLFGHTGEQGRFSFEVESPISDDLRKAILFSNFLPLEEDIYLQDDFAGFLERRADILLECIDQLCMKGKLSSEIND